VMVKEYPKPNANTTVARLDHPRPVPITIPNTSPIAHPLRQ
jgi:hypothetical protein